MTWPTCSARSCWAADPFATTLRVTGILDGKAVTRHVVILTVGRMQQMDIPQADQPWMTLADSLGIPLEWSAHVTPRADKDVLAEIRLHPGEDLLADQPLRGRARDGRSLGVGGAAGAGAAGRAGTVRPGGCLAGPRQGMVADRGIGPDRIRVPGSRPSGSSPRSAARSRSPTPSASTTWPVNSSPGPAVVCKAHMRKLPLRAVAAGGPAVTSMAGDRRGWNIGRSSLDNSPVMFDFWRNMEDYDVSGLFPIISGLGGGKTNLLGMIVAKTAAAGIGWCVIDPAGRLGRLGRTAQLRAGRLNIDLLNGAPGQPEPLRAGA